MKSAAPAMLLPPALVLVLFLLPIHAASQSEPTGCVDLGSFPPSANIDFKSDIEPLFETCLGCHGSNGAAQLDLTPGQAFDQLVGVPAQTAPDRNRVEPFQPEESVLLAAINCAEPAGPAFQMTGIAPEDRALVRDWIAQGAPRSPAAQPVAIPLLQTTIMVVLALLLAAFGLLRLRGSIERPGVG